MRLLLDTHALLWWLTDSDELSAAARSVISDRGNTIYVSGASTWEIATKSRKGKLNIAPELIANLTEAILGQGFEPLPISLQHGQSAGALPGPHKDPFDRMLIAQAMMETLVLVSNEVPFDAYGVQRLW